MKTGLSRDRKFLQWRPVGSVAGAHTSTHAWVTSTYIQSFPGLPGKSLDRRSSRSVPAEVLAGAVGSKVHFEEGNLLQVLLFPS